ncbi:hypothetical protein OGZ02_16350 [Brachyspira hyodysenteriae]|nr:hypothetical protein [Brachyspira hyodysenteriae]MDA1470334.1 hypothetical protein [Brachyspira hyodysenteriae]
MLLLSYRFAYYSKEYMHSAALKAGFDASIPVSGYQNIVTGEPYLLLALRLPKSLDKSIIQKLPYSE